MTPIQPILSVHTSSFMLILLPQNSVLGGGGVTQITMDPISYRIAHLKKSTPKTEANQPGSVDEPDDRWLVVSTNPIWKIWSSKLEKSSPN